MMCLSLDTLESHKQQRHILCFLAVGNVGFNAYSNVFPLFHVICAVVTLICAPLHLFSGQ